MAGKSWIVMCLGLILSVSSTQAVEHKDTSGFSLSAPNDWTLISKINQQNLPADTRQWLSKNRIDLNRLSVVLLRPGTGDFIENMNVVVENQAMPIDSNTIRKLLTEIPDQYRTLGVTLQDFRISTKKYGEHETIVLDYQTKSSLSPLQLTQKQVFFSGGGKTFIVTCTATQNTMAQYVTAFEEILNKMQIPSATSVTVSQNGVNTIDYRASFFVSITVGIVIGVVGMVKNFLR
jgi:hypothetical protein